MTVKDITGFIDIDDHALLLVKGKDAQKFLQGQLTCDINQLTIEGNRSQSILGAHCTHKGRMLFSFRAVALDSETFGLSIYKPLLEDARKVLHKYSVFSKVELIDARDDYRLLGFLGSESEKPLSEHFAELPAHQGHAIRQDQSIAIKVRENRYEFWISKKQLPQLGAMDHKANGDYWTWCNIQDGIGEVRPQTVEEFIPQMLNLQVLDSGISFTKGCYTGQEVVARMKYLGKLKRHMYRLSLASSPETGSLKPELTIEAGLPLYTPGKQQSIGNVVIAASHPSGSSQEILAVVTEEAITVDEVYLDPNFHQKLKALPLPYAITNGE
jgi:folate-binding protein YgfZ